MKAYFIRLFNYDHYANFRTLTTILKTEDHEKAEQSMAHLLAAQQIWLSRCKGDAAVGVVLWPDWKADTFEQIINDNHQKWIVFLEGLNDDDFERSINYKDLKGNCFENKLA